MKIELRSNSYNNYNNNGNVYEKGALSDVYGRVCIRGSEIISSFHRKEKHFSSLRGASGILFLYKILESSSF